MIRIALVFAMASLPSVALAEAPWTCPAVTPAQVSPSDAAWKSKPFVDGNIRFVGGKVPTRAERHLTTASVFTATTVTTFATPPPDPLRQIAPWAGESISVTSPIVDETTGERAIIGSLSKVCIHPLHTPSPSVWAHARTRTQPTNTFMSAPFLKMGGDGAVEAVEAASAAWDMGQGEWPQMSLAERIARIEAVVTDLQEVGWIPVRHASTLSRPVFPCK